MHRSLSINAISSNTPGTLDFRIHFVKGGKPISPWHDVPLFADPKKRTYNFIVEIPKNTYAKFEISKSEQNNPIKQDTKNGKLRFIPDVHDQKGYPWNYGAFPQTWEDPSNINLETGTGGDDDPLDGCEIGSQIGQVGELKVVKILGVLGMIDQGETDWKILCIDINDKDAERLNDVSDIERVRPGFLAMLHNWFRDYKIPEGKPPNQFAYDGKARDREFAKHILEENHQFWRNKFQKATNG